MALTLTVLIAGTVPPGVVRLLANGVEVALNGNAYEAEVPATSGVVALTSITAAGSESVRTIRIVATPTAAG